MKASKLLVSTAAAVAMFGSIGLACAQTPTTPADPGAKPPAAPSTKPGSTKPDPATQTPMRSDSPSTMREPATSASPGGTVRSDTRTGTGSTAGSDTRAMASERPARAGRN